MEKIFATDERLDPSPSNLYNSEINESRDT